MTSPRCRFHIGIAVAILCTSPGITAQVFVRANAAPGGIGNSWQTAFSDLHTALEATTPAEEVWVAAGTYRPVNGATPFALRSGITLLGGFAGTETNSTQRDWIANVTVLTGDMLNNDGPQFVNYGDNAGTLCRLRGNDTSTTIDGFVLTAASNSAIVIDGSSPIIRHCSFRWNHGGLDGGAIENVGPSQPRIEACVFEDNYAIANGGAIYNISAAHPRIIGCTFRRCASGEAGGAITSTAGCSPILRDCIFSQNSSPRGAAMNQQSGGIADIFQCVFEENTAATDGGAILCPTTGFANAINCLFRANASPIGSVINSLSDSPSRFVNCIFFANSGPEISATMPLDVTSCCTQQPYSGSGNFVADPQLTLAPNGLWVPGIGSPCIDRGDNVSLPFGVILDLVGGPRLSDDPMTPDQGIGIAPIVDLGPVEYLFIDCNENGTADSVEIGQNQALDADLDGTLDSCEIPGTPFCFGDGSIPTLCPCVPPNIVPNPGSAPGHGCANSFNADGALLSASGTTAPDSVRFTCVISSNYANFALMVKGNASSPNGVQLNDGIMCVSGTIVRFGSHYAATGGAPLGVWTFPNTIQTTPVSIATAQGPAQHAYYQLYYRNAMPNFCAAATANLSNAVDVAWR